MKRTMRVVMTGVALAALAVMPSTAARAQGAPPSDRWHYILTPYGWFAGFDGTVAAEQTPVVDVDAPYNDIVDDLDFGMSFSFEARKGLWGGLLDLSFVEMSRVAATSLPGYRADVVTQTGFVNGAIAYQIFSETVKPLDVFAGARFWDVNHDLHVTSEGQPDRSGSSGGNWADPIVGVRFRPEFNRSWYGRALADVGGFGVASDMTYQLYGAVGYRFTELFSLSLGYRYLAVDYQSGEFVYDVRQQGALFGVGLTF